MNTKITAKQFISTCVLFMISSIQVINIYPNKKINIWFAAIIGAAASLPILFMFARLSGLYPEKDIWEITETVLGKFFGKTVSVIDASTFTVINNLDVAMNPQTLHVASNNKIYLIALGNYADVPAKLQKINTSTDTVSDVPDIEPTNMAIGKNGVAYILSTVYDENWNAISSYYTFDTAKDKLVGELASPADIPNGYSIFADKITGDVYIGTSDYISNGDVYLLSADGEILMKFDTGGLNPIAICTVEK